MTQDFDQGDFYFSASVGRREEVKFMPIPYAQRALDKLVRENGADVLGTRLGLALAQRIQQGDEAIATPVPSLAPGAKMLRGRGGKFTGAWRKSAPRSRGRVAS